MAFSFTFHHDLRLVYKRCWDSYDDNDSAEAHRIWDEINQEGEVDVYNELQDLRDVTSYGVSIEQIHKLADHYEHIWRDKPDSKKMAYVVPTALAFGTGRVYSAMIDTTGINFHVFSDIDEAAEWLALSPKELEMVLARDLEPAYSSEP